jgi:hypothetical protein
MSPSRRSSSVFAVNGKLCPDSSVICVAAMYTSTSEPFWAAKRIGIAEPVNMPGTLLTHAGGQ